MKVNDSVANPDTANPPAIAVPEALALPEAGLAISGVGDIGRATIIAVTGSGIAGPVIAVLGCDRAADNGTPEQSGSDACGNAALSLGRLGAEARDALDLPAEWLPHALVLVGRPDPAYVGRTRPPVPLHEIRRFR